MSSGAIPASLGSGVAIIMETLAEKQMVRWGRAGGPDITTAFGAQTDTHNFRGKRGRQASRAIDPDLQHRGQGEHQYAWGTIQTANQDSHVRNLR